MYIEYGTFLCLSWRSSYLSQLIIRVMYHLTLILLKDLFPTSLQLCLPKNLFLLYVKFEASFSVNVNNFIFRTAHKKICNKKRMSCLVNKKCLNVDKYLLRFKNKDSRTTPSVFNVDLEQAFSYKALLPKIKIYSRDVFRTQSKTYGGPFLRK